MVARSKRYKDPAAVVYIKLVNYSYIKKTWGVAVAEQSLLRSVIKLRRLLRDVDTVGRTDEAVFGLILEGVSERMVVTGLAARLIAAGLMPLKGLKPEVVEEDPRAHHFAQGVGGVFLLASALFTLGGLSAVGAVLGVVVIALAALNLSQKICVGCLMYFQYRRLRYVVLHR